MGPSIMDFLGLEIIGVMSPVSICMLLVVFLVSALSPPPSSLPSPPPITAANLVYLESPSDSSVQKLEGALLNAAVFIALVTAVTFLLVLLYYYNFTSFLKNYMRFSAFFVLFSMGGSILLSLLRRLSLPLDAPTAVLLLFNFSAVGVLSVFSPAVPILLRQIYMVSLGIIVATWFTKLPEWTTWILLLALAVYDLVAVLTPNGPLRLLVNLASSRDEDLPAFVYEARPTVSSPPLTDTATAASLELQPVSDPNSDQINNSRSENCEETSPLVVNRDGRRQPDSAGRVGNPNPSDPNSVLSHRLVESIDSSRTDHSIVIENPEEETLPLVANQDSNPNHNSSGLEMFETTRGIRLGLGDFVFYSVLVGRAAMYDLMTVYACYLAIISGLGCTLILLSVWRQALPALPISITLGVMFYFFTRLLMEPFVVGASTSLVMF